MLEQLAALQDSVRQLQVMLLRPKKFRFVVLYPDGSRDHCLCDAQTTYEALEYAETIAHELHEFAIVEKLEVLK